jgi:ACS family tartrate transporter-like MFS transporter
MVTWGIVTIGTAFVQNVMGLTIARILLGAAEAGFSPGMLYFVSRWFPAVQRGRVMSWIVTFICLSSLGTAVTGHVLALDGVLGFGGWRWVVIITGVPAIMMGVVCFRTLREDPASGVLSADERTWLTARLAEDAADDGDPHSTRDFFRALSICRVSCWWSSGSVTHSVSTDFSCGCPRSSSSSDYPTLGGLGGCASGATRHRPMLWSVRRSDRAGERSGRFAAVAAISMSTVQVEPQAGPSSASGLVIGR